MILWDMSPTGLSYSIWNSERERNDTETDFTQVSRRQFLIEGKVHNGSGRKWAVEGSNGF